MNLRLLTASIALFSFATSCGKKEDPSPSTPPASPEPASADAPPAPPAPDSPPAESKHESLANKIMESMHEFGSAVSEVADTETANKAAEKIGEIGDRFSQIADELKDLVPPPEELKEAINAKMEEKDAELQELMGGDLEAKLQSLGDESREVLQKAFGEFFGKMDAVGEEFERHFGVGDDAESKED